MQAHVPSAPSAPAPAHKRVEEAESQQSLSVVMPGMHVRLVRGVVASFHDTQSPPLPFVLRQTHTDPAQEGRALLGFLATIRLGVPFLLNHPDPDEGTLPLYRALCKQLGVELIEP